MDEKDSNPYRPSELMTSKMRFYSMGIVAENKALGSKEIEVTPIEELTMLDGELTSKVTDYKATASDALGQSYQSTVKTNVSIKATWLPFGASNRITAPDVRRGEAVMIFQFADAPKYYWMTIKQDSDLRKLETVVYAFSGTRDENAKTDADNSYYLEVSTHKKIVHFHTSKADGEPFAYDIQINAKEGYIGITDDAGNFIALDSTNRRLQMKNIDGSHLDIDKKIMTITTVDQIIQNTKKWTLNAEESIVNGKTTTLNTDTSVTKTTKLVQGVTMQGGANVAGGSGAAFIITGGLDVDQVDVGNGGLTVAGYSDLNGGYTGQ